MLINSSFLEFTTDAIILDQFHQIRITIFIYFFWRRPTTNFNSQNIHKVTIMDEKRERSPSFHGMSTNRRFINPNRSPSYHTLVHTQDKQPHLGSKKPRFKSRNVKEVIWFEEKMTLSLSNEDISLNAGSVKLVAQW